MATGLRLYVGSHQKADWIVAGNHAKLRVDTTEGRFRTGNIAIFWSTNGVAADAYTGGQGSVAPIPGTGFDQGFDINLYTAPNIAPQVLVNRLNGLKDDGSPSDGSPVLITWMGVELD
jgi:hypothetical protein